MSLMALMMRRLSMRFPRVSGDEPEYEVSLDDGDMFSPREWG